MSVRTRTFLQPARDDVDSYVVVDIPNKREDYSIGLKVADCTRSVNLWFPWSTPEKIKTSRAKLAKLRAALDKIEKGLDNLAN